MLIYLLDQLVTHAACDLCCDKDELSVNDVAVAVRNTLKLKIVHR